MTTRDARFVATSTQTGRWHVMDFGDFSNLVVINERPLLYKYEAEYIAKRLNEYAEVLTEERLAQCIAQCQEKMKKVLVAI